MRIIIVLAALSLLGCGDDGGDNNPSNPNNLNNANNPSLNNPSTNNPNANNDNNDNNGEIDTQWELESTDYHPRISGSRAHLSDDSTLVIDESRPEGWRIEVQANKPLSVGLHAFGNTDTELGLTLEHPDGTCEIPISASNAAIQLTVQAIEAPSIWGSLVFTVQCFDAPEPITLYLGFGSTDGPANGF